MTLYRRQLVSSRAAGGPAPALNRCARPPRHRVFRPRLPSMLHADVRTNIHSLSHLTPLTPPGRRPAEARCEVRPVRRRRSRPVAATDRRRPFLIAATGSVCDSGTWPNPPAVAERLTAWPNNLPLQSFAGRATLSRSSGRQVIMSLLPTCLRVAGKVVSRPPLLCETLRRRWWC